MEGKGTSEGTRDRGRTGAAVDDVPPLLAFVHIPKTAGGTVTGMFVNAYSKAGLHKAGNYFKGSDGSRRKLTKRPKGWESWSRRGGRVSIGHVPYGLFREHLPPATRYMTFLREPVDRVLSHYFRHINPSEAALAAKEKRKPSASAEGKRKVGSLEQALIEMQMPEINNLATRCLCGDPSPTGRLPASAVEDAKANLREFAFVGIQERFEESVVVLQRLLDIDFVPTENRHVNSDRPGLDEISPEDRALIVEHNELDIELYEFGVGLFEDAVKAAGDGVEADAQKLRESSAAANDLYERSLEEAQEWLDRELPLGTRNSEAALRSAAEEAGFNDLILKRARKALGAQRRFDRGEGQWILSRVPEGDLSEQRPKSRPTAVKSAGDDLGTYLDDSPPELVDLFTQIDAFGQALGGDVTRRVLKRYVSYLAGPKGRPFFTVELRPDDVHVLLTPSGSKPWKEYVVTNGDERKAGDSEYVLSEPGQLDDVCALIEHAYESLGAS